jgi:hypothetical protein
MTDTVVKFPSHMSYSQVSSLRTCGWRYVLEKGFHVPQLPSWATVGGSAIHTATEWWDNWTLNDNWVTDRPTIEKLFNDAFDQEIAERLKQEPDFTVDQWRASGRASKAWPNKEDEQWWRSEGPSMVMSWVTWRTNNSQWEIAMLPGAGGEARPGIELECKPTIGGGQVIQYIDRLFTNRDQTQLLVVDIKSGREPDSGEQLGSYGLGLEETFEVTPAWGAYWMARTGGTTAFEDMRLWTKERLDYIYSTAAAIREQGLLLPKKSMMCSGCSVRDFCLEVNGAQSDTIPAPWEISVEISAPKTLPQV